MWKRTTLIGLVAMFLPAAAHAGTLGLLGGSHCDSPWITGNDQALRLCKDLRKAGDITEAGGERAYSASIVAMATPDWQKKTAAEKMQKLTEQRNRLAYTKLPPTDYGTLAFGFSFAWNYFSFGQFFDTESDVLTVRDKTFHRFGTEASFELVPAAGHDYTGFFKTGGYGVARASLGQNEENWISGIALKFLRDGKPSVNVIALPHPDPQESKDFFANKPTTVIPPPEQLATTIGTFLLSFHDDPANRPVDLVAGSNTQGEEIKNPKAPYRLVFVPNPTIKLDTKKDFRTELAKLPAGTVLYKVHAVENEGDTTTKYIGDLVLTTPFKATWFGDHLLMFQHRRAPKPVVEDPFEGMPIMP